MQQTAHITSQQPVGRSLWDDAFERLRNNRAAMAAAAIMGAIVLLVLAAPLLSPYSIDSTDWDRISVPPSFSTGHWFGTDDVGRDLFVRTLYGGRISLLVGLAATLVSLVIGIAWGATAGYAGGKAINNLGEAIRGHREDYIIGLKITWGPDDDRAMDAALNSLGIEQADICFFNIHKAADVRQDRYRKGAERWKAAGKFRYIGLTSHSDTLACMQAGLKEGFYDVLMPAYSLGMEDAFEDVFQQAQDRGTGVVLMKTGRGLGHDAYADAIPTYLNMPGVTTINKGMNSFDAVTRMLESARRRTSDEASTRLRSAARVAMSGHCIMCGACTNACPHSMPVADVVRCSDYYMEQPEYLAFAGEVYTSLPRRPADSLCGSCSSCETACPNGVPIRHHIRRADAMLA